MYEWRSHEPVIAAWDTAGPASQSGQRADPRTGHSRMISISQFGHPWRGLTQYTTLGGGLEVHPAV